MSKPLVKAVVGTVLIVIGAVTGQPWLVKVGANLILAGGAQALQKSPKGPGSREREGLEINVTGEDAPVYRVYGEVKLGGHLSILGTSGDRNQYLHYAVTHSVANACGVEGVTDVWVGERKIDETEIDASGNATDPIYSGFVKVSRYRGTSSETADPDLVAALSYVDADARGDYMAKTVWTFERDIATEEDDEAFSEAFPHGAPQVQALVRGQKCYDPRKDSTNGGSGTHRLNDPSTWEWSRNPILCSVDYALAAGSLGGVDVDSAIIHWPSVATAASVCDESISVPDGFGGSVSRARYLLDIALDTNEDTKPNLDKMLATCLGAVVYTGDSLKFHAGTYEPPATTVDNDWLAGAASVRRITGIKDGKYNAVRSTFIDPGAEYQTVQSVPFTSTAYEAQDGGKRLWKEVRWAGLFDRYSAQALNTILGRMSRNQKIVIAELNYRGLDIEAWEIVNLDFPDLDVSGAFRVTAWDWTDAGPKVTFEEVAPDTYDLALSDFTEVTPSPRPGETHEKPPIPTGLTATATADGIALQWVNPGLSEFSEIHVERSADGATGWVAIHQTRSNAYTDPVTDGATWHYRIRARSATRRGIYSDYSNSANATAKAALAGGRGVNVMHPRYSTFEEHGIPPIVTSNCSVDRNASSQTAAHGTKSLAIISAATGTTWAFFSTTVTTYNLYLRPGKYIVSAFCRQNTGNTNTANLEVRLRRSTDGAYYVPFSPAMTDTKTRYSGVVDLSGNADGTTYNVSAWVDGAATGDIQYIDAIMIEELAGNQTEPSEYSPPVGAVGDTMVAADSGRLADQRSALAIVNGNYTNNTRSISGGSLLSSFDAGLDASIRLNASTFQFGFGPVSYNQVDSTGKTYGAKYYVYASDPSISGGTVSLLASTTDYIPQSDQDYVYFGTITTATSGGGNTGGGGGATCVQADAWIDLALQAKDVARGSELLCWAGDEMFLRPAHDVLPPQVVPCVRIETETGATITCSIDTPIEQPDGRTVFAANMHGGKVLAEQKDGSFQWEPVKGPHFVGLLPVVPISVGGISFAASDEKGGRRIVTHNMAKPITP